MFNINDYIVETIVFAHVMPITRNYAILVFLGRKKKAICNRIIFALARLDNGEMTIIDEISIPSCDMMRENSEILLASDSVNINFKIGDSSTATVSYTDHDFFAEEANVSEKYTFRIQNSQWE